MPVARGAGLGGAVHDLDPQRVGHGEGIRWGTTVVAQWGRLTSRLPGRMKAPGFVAAPPASAMARTQSPAGASHPLVWTEPGG